MADRKNVQGILRDGSFHYLTLVFHFQGDIEAGAFQAISMYHLHKGDNIKIVILFCGHESKAQRGS